MENYEYSKEWDKCTYWLYVGSCRQCLFETLCRLEKNKQKYLPLEKGDNEERKEVQ